MTVQKTMSFNKSNKHFLISEFRLRYLVSIGVFHSLRPLVRNRTAFLALCEIPSIHGHNRHILVHPLVRKRHILVPLLLLLSLFFMTSLNAQVSVNANEQRDNDVSVMSMDGRPFLHYGAKSQEGGAITNHSTSKPVLSAQKANTELKYYTLYAETWEIARSGESMLSFSVLNQIINVWLEDRQKKIEIQYPGGEEGELWVHELTDWLVSLGIPSDHLVVIAGSGADDVINFALIK